MQVREILKSNRAPATIEGDQSVYEAMKIMTEKRCGSLIVVDDHQNPIGIITESDIFVIAFKYFGDMVDLRIRDNMSSDLILGVLDDEIDFIAEVMVNNNIQHIPIMDHQEKLCGVISIRDIVRANLKISALSAQ